MKFFCVCEDCGSTDWVELSTDGESRVNSLREDGNPAIQNYKEHIGKWVVENLEGVSDIFCSYCEKKVYPIPLKEIPLPTRKKIYFMSDKDKIAWVKGYLIAKKLVREQEENDEETNFKENKTFWS